MFDPFGRGNNTPFPTEDPELAKMYLQNQQAMQKALEENAEINLAACQKCGVTDLTMVTLAEVILVRVPEMPTEGIKARDEMIPRPRLIQFYCPMCGELVAQKKIAESANPKVLDKNQVDTKEIITEDGKKIVVPDIEKDLEEAAPLNKEEEKEEPSDPTT
jgi:hypothetical protein